MKTTVLILFITTMALSLSFAEPPVKISIKGLGDKKLMERLLESSISSYEEPLQEIRAALKTGISKAPKEQTPILQSSLRILSDILDRRDTSRVGELLPLVDLIQSDKAEEGHGMFGKFGSGAAKGTLNYLMSAVFERRLCGEGAGISDRDLTAMVKFYAGNPAQTDELSWGGPNTMLFLVGERVVNHLQTDAPDRLSAFYKDVLRGRADAAQGPGPDQFAIPAAERPTAEQLARYEAAFAKLERLATHAKTTPDSAGKSNADASPAQPPVQPHSLHSEQPSVPPVANSKTVPPMEQPASFPWLGAIAALAAVAGFIWVLLKKR